MNSLIVRKPVKKKSVSTISNFLFEYPGEK